MILDAVKGRLGKYKFFFFWRKDVLFNIIIIIIILRDHWYNEKMPTLFMLHIAYIITFMPMPSISLWIRCELDKTYFIKIGIG